jgi:FkbM family methyltransferase
MRKALFYNPRLLCERLAEISIERRRLRKLRGTVASGLTTGHIDSLELLELLKPDPPHVIYDIGANVGTWTLLAKAIFPEVEIHAFEPLPAHAERFKLVAENLANVHLHLVALGSNRTRANLRVTNFSDASSLLELTEIGKHQWNLAQIAEVPVPVERLDDWITQHQLSPPELLKLDVQGGELEVLRGAKQSLIKTKAILAEVSFKEFYYGQCQFDEVVSFLADHGFFVYAFGKNTSQGSQLIQLDVLFQRRGPSSQR